MTRASSDKAYTATLEDKRQLKMLITTLYQVQRSRIQLGNRLCADLRIRLGQDPGRPTNDISPEAQRLLLRMKQEYSKLATAIANLNMKRIRHLLDEEKGVIATPYQLFTTRQYVAMEEQEAELSHEIAQLVKEFPLWTEYLEGVKGVGPVLAAIIISELDPYIARRPSSFHRFAGLDVVPTYEYPSLAGSYERTAEGVTLRGAGAGLHGDRDQCHYLWHLSGGATTLSARLEQPAQGRTGLMLRYDCEPGAPLYALSVDGSGYLSVHYRLEAGSEIVETSLGHTSVPILLEITRRGARCSAALCGRDGRAQALDLSHRQVKLGGLHCAGLFCAGGPELAAETRWTDLQLVPYLGDPIGQTDEEWWGEDIGDPAVYTGGQGRSRRREHLVKREYKARDGTIKVRDSVTYQPALKTKLLGVLGPSFLKAGGHYADIYYQYKNRLENHPLYGLDAEARKVEGATKLHRHLMSTRYAVKMFLIDLHMKWREIEGLPVYPSYAEAKLHLHKEEPQSIDIYENDDAEIEPL